MYMHTAAGFYVKRSTGAAGTAASAVKCRWDISAYSQSSALMHLVRSLGGLEKKHLEILKIQPLLHNAIGKEQCIQQQWLIFVRNLSCVTMTGKGEVILRGGEAASGWGRVSSMKSVFSSWIYSLLTTTSVLEMLWHHFDLLKAVHRDWLHAAMNSHFSIMLNHYLNTNKPI